MVEKGRGRGETAAYKQSIAAQTSDFGWFCRDAKKGPRKEEEGTITRAMGKEALSSSWIDVFYQVAS